MIKNFGTPPVSGYLDPTGRAWETVVFEAGKPVLDRELNLGQDIDVGSAQDALRQLMPSGWLADDALGSSNSVGAIFTASALVNTIQIPNGLFAHVNGWLLKVQHTNVTGSNQVLLGAAPSGAASQRTDLVILEVWRRLVRTGNTAGKSAAGRIWQQGNVATDPLSPSDTALNYADDLLDPAAGFETTARVQIQYRLRSVQSVDLFASLSGMTSANTVARSVPPNAATPNGNVTVHAYVNQSAAGDPGLWRAGNGDPSNTLGTIDGYMYAIPLLGVFRRNSTAFARVTNQNGAGASTGSSGRPDGLFHDIVAAVDVVDLRNCVNPNGWSLPEVLEKNVNLILDNAKRTEIYNHQPYGGGNSGTTVFMSNEIGGSPTAASPRSAVQQFDAVRRKFSARPIMEQFTVRIPPPAGGWVENSTVVIDPSALPVYPYAAFNWTAVAPADVMLLEITEMHWAGTNAAGQKYYNAYPYLTSATGLGAIPVTSLTLKLDGMVGTGLSLTNEPLFVTLVALYPPGKGLTHTPVETFGTASFQLTTAALSAAAPISFSAFTAQSIDAAHREVQLEYQTASVAYSFRNGFNPLDGFYLPEKVTSVSVGVLDGDGRHVTMSVAANAVVTLNYTAVRPLPQLSSPQMAIYFRTAAPQMAPSTVLGTSLTLTPRLSSEKLYTLTVGAGSQDEAYPFPQAYVQTGGVFPTTPGTVGYLGEVDLLGGAQIAVGNFNSQTGLLSLPLFVPMVTPSDALVLQRSSADLDTEGRTYFSAARLSPVPPFGYIPNAYAQNLSTPDRHKNIYPILAELAQDSALGPKGQLVIVLFVRYAVFDDDNAVFFETDLNVNTTSASVFRVKGLLLNKRAQ